MTNIRLILGDQLSHGISSLSGCNRKEDIIVMAEVMNEATYVKHHKKKIIFIFSAMRNFSKELIKKGYRVEYSKLTDRNNSQSIAGEVERAVKKYRAKSIITTFPGEYRVLKDIKSWSKKFKLPVEIREDDRFIASIDEFKKWSENRKLRMEYFYREMRLKTNTLVKKWKANWWKMEF